MSSPSPRDVTPLEAAIDADPHVEAVDGTERKCSCRSRSGLALIVVGVLALIAVIAVSAAAISGNYAMGNLDCDTQAAERGGTEEPELVTYDSCAALAADLSSSNCVWYSNEFSGNFGTAERGEAVAMAAEDTSGGATGGNAGPSAPPEGGGQDVSGTNNQVEGIDESDVVKTDGEFIYTLSGGWNGREFVITRAFPTNEPLEVVGSLDLKEVDVFGTELFIQDDRALIFGWSQHSIPAAEVPGLNADSDEGNSIFRGRRDSMAYGYGGSSTDAYYFSSVAALLVDISDRAAPTVLRRVDVEGGFLTARKIGDVAYMAVQTWPHYFARNLDDVGDRELLPLIRDTADATASAGPEDDERGSEGYADFVPVCTCGAVQSVSSIRTQSFVTIAGISMKEGDEDAWVRTKTVAGTGSSVYAVQDMMMVAASNWNWEAPHTAVLTFKLPQHSGEADDDAPGDVGAITFDGIARAPGNILNQFSMDAHEGYFRIATTSRIQVPGDDDDAGDRPVAVEASGGRSLRGRELRSISVNNVYVFDLNEKVSLQTDKTILAKVLDGVTTGSVEALADGEADPNGPRYRLTGWLEGLAPDEQIYSARFVGKRLYMVTFRTVDPLFVIDLADPRRPSVLGELKIPGFSQYLHPVNETHLIGVGKDAEVVRGWGDTERAIPIGVKLSMFDASDVYNPREAFNIGIGDRGSHSEALYDHKAFLFDADTGLLVLPIGYSIIPPGEDQHNWGREVVQGAFAFTVTDHGFFLRAVMSHDAFWRSYGADDDIHGPMLDEDQELRSYSYRSDTYVNYEPYMLPRPWGPPTEGEVADDRMAELAEWAEGAYKYFDDRGVNVWGNWNRRVQRSLYIDDSLYTVSPTWLVASDRDSFLTRSEVQTASSGSGYYYAEAVADNAGL